MDEIVLRFTWNAALYREASGAVLQAVTGRQGGRRWPFVLGTFLVWVLSVAGIVALLQLDVLVPRDLLLFSFGVLAMCAVWAALAWRMQRRHVAMAMGSVAHAGPILLRVSAQGIATEMATSRGAIDWPAVSAVLPGKLGLYAVIGGAQAMPLPDAALPEGMDRAALAARIEGWRTDP